MTKFTLPLPYGHAVRDKVMIGTELRIITKVDANGRILMTEPIPQS